MNKIDLQPRAVIKELQENIKGLTSKASLKVGFFESSRYDNGNYVAEVARDNEFGTLKIPPRPFLEMLLMKIQKNGLIFWGVI